MRQNSKINENSITHRNERLCLTDPRQSRRQVKRKHIKQMSTMEQLRNNSSHNNNDNNNNSSSGREQIEISSVVIGFSGGGVEMFRLLGWHVSYA